MFLSDGPLHDRDTLKTPSGYNHWSHGQFSVGLFERLTNPVSKSTLPVRFANHKSVCDLRFKSIWSRFKKSQTDSKPTCDYTNRLVILQTDFEIRVDRTTLTFISKILSPKVQNWWNYFLFSLKYPKKIFFVISR